MNNGAAPDALLASLLATAERLTEARSCGVDPRETAKAMARERRQRVAAAEELFGIRQEGQR